MYVHGFLASEWQAVEPFCEAAADHMEPLTSIVSYHQINENRHERTS